MRERFTSVVARAIDEDERVALVLAEIGVAPFEETGVVARHPRRVVNVGIREQLLIGVVAGFALEGFRPVAHSYAPFLVERPYEQLKLDLGHQNAGAILVSVGASYDSARSGRTHQAPEDVAVVATLPGWTVHAPGHADEVERLLRHALARDHRVYIRLGEESNRLPIEGDGVVALRRGSETAPLVLAVGPTLDAVVAATAELDVTVAYTSTPVPLDAGGLRDALRGSDVVLVEPYLAGTSAAAISAALRDRPHRLLALGVDEPELRRYGTGAEHRAAHGLDPRGIRAALDAFS